MEKILVTENKDVSELTIVDRIVSHDEGLEIVSKMQKNLYFDSEAASTKFMKDPIVMIQLYDKEVCVLIDCRTVDILEFKSELERRRLIIHNAKNDICFLYVAGIFPQYVWCTMVIEKLIAYGIPVNLGLDDLVKKYCDRYLDKSDKGRILYELSDRSLEYCMNDVLFLPDIHEQQKILLEKNHSSLAGLLENKFLPVLAYMEFCGVKLNTDKWQEVIKINDENAVKALNELDEFIYKEFPKDSKLCLVDMQGDLFEGFKESKKCFVKWNSDSSISTVYSKCNDEQKIKLNSILKQYRTLKDITKIYGNVYLLFVGEDGRIHPHYKQLTSEGRISCPQKGYSDKGYEIPMPSFMNLPNNSLYRESVEADDGNILIGADWSAHEICIMAYISGDKRLLEIVNSGKNVHDEMYGVLKGKIPDSDYNLLYEHRKQLNLMICYLGSDYGISEKFKCSRELAAKIVVLYARAFPGLSKYQKDRTENIIYKGSIAFNDSFGYRMYIQEIDRMRRIKGWFNRNFWKNFSVMKQKFPDSPAVKDVIWYQKEKSRLQRLSVQAPCSNTGSIMFKYACINLMKMIREKELIKVVKIIIPQHDSITIECPESMQEECIGMLVEAMKDGCSKVCPGLNIRIKTWSGKTYR